MYFVSYPFVSIIKLTKSVNVQSNCVNVQGIVQKPN